MKFGKIYFVILLLFSLLVSKALAQDNWQLVVIPQANLNSKHSEIAPQVYLGITNALTTQLVNDNFTVFDQSLLKLNNCINQICEVISDNKLLNLAQIYNYKAQQLAVSLAIVYQIEIFDEMISKVKGVRFNFSSYLIDLDSGERVESYRDSKKYNDLSTNCEGDCFVRWQAKKATQIAQDAGYILALKINRLPKRYRYEIEFSHFNSRELKAVTDFLNSISEKKSHIALSDLTIRGVSSSEKSNKHITITTSHHASKLNQLLQNEFEKKSISVLIDYRSTINKFTIIKNLTAINWQYISFIFVCLLGFVALYFYFPILNKNIIIKNINHAIAVKNYYLAYSMIDKLLSKNKYNKQAVISELSLLRKKIDRSIISITGNVVANKALAGVHFLTETKLDLGKKTQTQEHSVIVNNHLVLGYKQLDELGKQCQFIYKNSHFYIVDKGSLHGCQYNDIRLLQGHLAQVKSNSILFIANDTDQELKVCQLKLNLSQYDPSALIMSLNPAPLSFLDFSDLALVWPDHELDLNKIWVMLGKRVALGLKEKGIIDIGCINGADVLAYLSYNSGYFIEPVKNKVTKLKINNQEVYSKLPIDKNALITLSDCEFSLG
ncbi:hypothetical protein CJF42_06640 [Pseudoalteromonas sp. NBT06-2]|uniref:hypothetical protein n=1 Tax=Pseudoalteromonas sp. NBT06-2 TaxID=2025950 RepID=UPI000BA52440|nr:hypothetical protein [Pseudoalteromonas sp. NBT06-2]PAJ75163.1 hypothetical protein CJF42_06640 [Pseudoalteromonas sp. NBT06-2]